MTAPQTHTIPPESRPILGIVLTSFAMIVVDNSIVFTGLSKIQTELGFTNEGLAWISSIYALTFGGFLLVGARAGDLLGRRRVFMAGLLLFSLASTAIGFVSSPSMLVISRAVQGLGAAIVAPSSLALLQAEFPQGPTRTRALSYYAAAGGVSASVGLVLGGIFAGWFSWRLGFFINVPIGILLIWALKRYVPATSGGRGRIDIIGAITSTLAIGLLLVGIERSALVGVLDPWTFAALVASVVLLVVFIVVQAKVKLPLIPLRLFVSFERSGAYLSRTLFLGANMGFFFFISQFMQDVLGFNAAYAGIAFLPSTIVNFAAAIVVARYIQRYGSFPVLLVTACSALVGMAWLCLLTPTSTYWANLVLPLILVGIGQGGSLAPLTTAGLSDVAAEDAGAASGVLNVAQQLGSSLGISVIVAYAASATYTPVAATFMAERVVRAMQAATTMLSLVILIVLVLLARKVARPSARSD